MEEELLAECFEGLQELKRNENMPSLTPDNLRARDEIERKSYATVLANGDIGYGSYINE